MTKIEGMGTHKWFTKLNQWFTEQINSLPNSDLEYKMILSIKYTVYQILLYFWLGLGKKKLPLIYTLLKLQVSRWLGKVVGARSKVVICRAIAGS